MHMIVFTAPFCYACGVQPFASSIVTPQGYKAGGHSYATYIFPHDLPWSLCPLPMAKKKEDKEKQI
jgi:hypothetical protein